MPNAVPPNFLRVQAKSFRPDSVETPLLASGIAPNEGRFDLANKLTSLPLLYVRSHRLRNLHLARHPEVCELHL